MKIRSSLLAIVAVAAVVLIGVVQARATDILVESFENTLDGWAAPPSYNLQAGAGQWGPIATSFDTANGVTEGSYSLLLTGSGTGGPNYGQMYAGPASTGLTTLLATAQSVSFDVYTAPGSFGFLQFDLDISNSGTVGFQSLDGYSYAATTVGSEHTFTVPIPAFISGGLQAPFSAGTTTALIIQVGGGGNTSPSSIWLDNIRVTVPEPASLSLLGFGGLSLIGMAIRRRRS
jgi:hypothetical protein